MKTKLLAIVGALAAVGVATEARASAVQMFVGNGQTMTVGNLMGLPVPAQGPWYPQIPNW